MVFFEENLKKIARGEMRETDGLSSVYMTITGEPPLVMVESACNGFLHFPKNYFFCDTLFYFVKTINLILLQAKIGLK